MQRSSGVLLSDFLFGFIEFQTFLLSCIDYLGLDALLNRCEKGPRSMRDFLDISSLLE